MPNIIINVNPEGGVQWQSEGMDGFDTMGVMAQCIFDMNQFFIKDPMRPPMDTVASRVCIEFDGKDLLAVSYRPEGNAQIALGMMQAALCGLANEMRLPDFDSMVAVLGAIQIPVTPRVENGKLPP